MSTDSLQIFTIGHGTRSWTEFVTLLDQYKIKILVDVRHFPMSQRHPQFNKESMEQALPSHGIQYHHIVSLGGRRTLTQKSDENSGWQHPSFRAYADYMNTDSFAAGIQSLLDLARSECTAIMCSETLWWRCHRRMISDVLVAIHKINVIHIITRPTKSGAREHTPTSFMVVKGSRLCYPKS